MSEERRRSVRTAADYLTPLLGDDAERFRLDDAREFIKRRKLLDFTVQPGRITAKANDEAGKTVRVEIRFSQLSEEAWERVFDQLSESAYHLALLLAGRSSADTAAVFEQHGMPLFPRAGDRTAILLNGHPSSLEEPLVSAALLQLSSRLEEDPFAAFLLRGRGREETIAELQKRRANRAPNIEPEEGRTGEQHRELLRALSGSLQSFWSFDKKLESLSYTIRADELPAALLKRRDPLPLGGLESEIDYQLEEAYERIARLAQSYGLGL